MAGSFKRPIAILLVVLALIGIAAAWKYLSGRAESKWLVLSGVAGTSEPTTRITTGIESRGNMNPESNSDGCIISQANCKACI